MIAETLAVIQGLLDRHVPLEQAQARAFIDARYPSLVSLVGEPPGAVRGGSKQVHNGSNAPVQSVQMNKVVSSFLQFWFEYPKKTGKQEALRIWKKLNPDQQLEARILQAVREQKTSADWTKDDGQFIPHPKTWLNQGRWDDEPVQRTGSLARRLWDEAAREEAGEK